MSADAPAPSATRPAGGERSYYGQPILKRPVWTWEVPAYFFLGGTAGSSAGLAYLAGLRGNEVLARRAWAASVAGLAVSPALLISDLGRSERFLNMLRMFKITSPMSVGSWILAASGTTTAIAAAHAWTGLLAGPARVARPAAALLGLPLTTYTGALIANTAVPVWHEGRWWLPLVFSAGGAMSAGGVAVALTPVASAKPARRVALASAWAEVAVKELMQRRLGEQGEPYERGRAALFSNISRACVAAGATLLYVRGGRSRGAAAASGALLCAGALSARLCVFAAGRESAADPKYVVGPQRARAARARAREQARTA